MLIRETLQISCEVAEQIHDFRCRIPTYILHLNGVELWIGHGRVKFCEGVVIILQEEDKGILCSYRQAFKTRHYQRKNGVDIGGKSPGDEIRSIRLLTFVSWIESVLNCQNLVNRLGTTILQGTDGFLGHPDKIVDKILFAGVFLLQSFQYVICTDGVERQERVVLAR